ncbi:hypothetical protein B0I35DRAFT_431890 [Stachybotrys elegans]|uniref:Spo12-like protein n=1 Tax=Stachybotrys elegans TaxID=80388 RepID=A0A8K0WQG8_9HYPO|nr:hypothetical protein B0I35DRAFT_431890 [Stachybotrys elegans]
MSTNVLANKDVNAPIMEQAAGKDIKSMEYHRQVFQSKIHNEPAKQYISPSDNIMSPCSAKIRDYRNKHATKAKPKSLFAQASAKRLKDDSPLGTRPNLP